MVEANTIEKLYAPVFARHETFHPRFGWLKKGYDAAVKNSDIFLEDDAAVILGVGKNMVRSIRYWCSAFGVLEEVNRKGSTGKEAVPTSFGKKLLSGNGWDPYLECNSSLWLLHWNLVQPSANATAWNYTFNEFLLSEFTDDHLFQSLNDYIKKEYPSLSISPASIKKDVNCILRMYAGNTTGRSKALTEETLDCPFSELGIIERVADSPYYSFKVGQKSGLEPEIIVATCLDYASFQETSASTIALTRLVYDHNGPGLAFKLTENDIYESIELIAGQYDNISISDSAGIIQLSFFDDPQKISNKILNNYFKNIA
jgi:hypothetical protein